MRNPLVKALVGLSLGASVLALAGCGNDDPAAPATASPSASATATGSASPSASASTKPSENFDAVKVEGAYGKAPKVSVKSPWTIDKTRTKVLQASQGPVVEAGSTVEVNYYGVNGRTGKKFDDSFSRGASIAFPLDQVVPGFRKGLTGQRQGSRVLIAMPGSDGYDASGGSAQAGINVGDTLIFVVDIVDVPLTGPAGEKVTPKAGLPTVSEGATPTVSVPKGDPPTTLQVQPLIKGKGKKVRATDTVTIDYTWLEWSTGKVLEQTYDAKPASAPLGSLLPGMQKGLAGQTVGSRVLLVIPPADGYPQGNATPKVNAGATLVMVVDLLYATAGQGQ